MFVTPAARILQFDDHTEEPVEDIVLPENLSDLSDEELADLETRAVEAFDATREAGVTPETLQTLSDLTTAIEAIRTEQGSRAEAAAQAQAAAEALAARVHAASDEGETPEDETPEGSPPPGGEEDDEDDETGGETPAPAEEEATAPAVVASAPRRIPLSAVRRNAPAPERVVVNDDPSRVSIVAAADVPGLVSMGGTLDLHGVATALHARARHLADGASAPVASFSRPARHVVEERASFDEQQAVIAAATAMPGDGTAQGLVASGGWCAPSETVYDLFSIEGQDGLVDVPTITVRRGGLEFPLNGGPSIADVFGSTGIWLWTEAMDIDAADNDPAVPLEVVEKPCAVIPCLTFDEERLDAHGVCLTHGNLADRAYPELTRRYVDLVMSAHAHIVNYRRLSAMAAAATDVTIAAGAHGAASPILDAVDLQGMDYRDKFRMDDGAVLEVVFPRWVRGLVRADLARRNGVDLLSVSNAEITRWFVERQYRPQFVYDWLSLQTGPSIAQGGADGFREAWPTEARALIYAAGTFVAGNGGSIDLNVTRDSTLNATNDHTAAFTEEFLLLAKRGHEARELIITGLAANGATGQQVAA